MCMSLSAKRTAEMPAYGVDVEPNEDDYYWKREKDTIEESGGIRAIQPAGCHHWRGCRGATHRDHPCRRLEAGAQGGWWLGGRLDPVHCVSVVHGLGDGVSVPLAGGRGTVASRPVLGILPMEAGQVDVGRRVLVPDLHGG